MKIHRLYYLIVVFAICLLLTDCEKNNGLNTVSINLIINSWSNSYEENTSDLYDIYRPSDFKDFSASRFRQVFNFLDNDTCYYLVLSPNDAHYMEKGNWNFDKSKNEIKITDSNGYLKYEFEIVELTESLLKIKK